MLKDTKQLKIFNRLCYRFKLNFNNSSKFIQHRNLKEFKYFIPYRINPNHHIILYGKLKKSYDKNKKANHIIKVGEIFLSGAYILLPITDIYLEIQLKSLMVITIFNILFDLTFDTHIKRFIENAYRYRRRFRLRKNSLCC